MRGREEERCSSLKRDRLSKGNKAGFVHHQRKFATRLHSPVSPKGTEFFRHGRSQETRCEFYKESVNVYNIVIEQIPAGWVARQATSTSRPLPTVAASDREKTSLAFANRTRAAASLHSQQVIIVTAWKETTISV